MTIICHYYTWYISRLWCFSLKFSIRCVFHQKKQWNCHHNLEPACTDVPGGAGSVTQSLQTHVLLSTYIWQVYTRYMYVISIQLDSCCKLSGLPGLISAQGRFRLDFLRILSVLATESPPIRGWGRQKFHVKRIRKISSYRWHYALTYTWYIQTY